MHKIWHIHFVANIFDSSHGICNAILSFGKFEKVYVSISGEMAVVNTSGSKTIQTIARIIIIHNIIKLC